MGYYQVLWKERRTFLETSSIFGIIFSIAFTVFMVTKIEIKSTADLFEILVIFFILIFGSTIVITVARMVFGNGIVGSNAVIGIVNSLWITIINSFTGSIIGMVLGVFEFMFFVVLFGIVTGIYTIYLPVTSIYYFIKARKEARDMM